MKWMYNDLPIGGVSQMAELLDVDNDTPANKDILIFNSTSGKYEPHKICTSLSDCVASTDDEDVASAKAVKELNSNLNVEPELTNAGYLYRIGKLRMLQINGIVVGANGVLGNYTIPQADRPTRYYYSMTVAVNAGKFYTSYIIVTPAGVPSCRYFLSNTSTDAVLGQGSTVYGTVIWYVEN